MNTNLKRIEHLIFKGKWTLNYRQDKVIMHE